MLTPNYATQNPDEPRRRAEYHHYRANIKYSPKKMWYICCLIRGLSVDEAIKQLSFVSKKGEILSLSVFSDCSGLLGALIAKEVLEEAQQIAVKGTILVSTQLTVIALLINCDTFFT